MPVYVAVAVNVPHAADVFTYHLPAELEGQVKLGQLVQAPFGRQTVQGVVVDFPAQAGVSQTKAIQRIIDPAAVLTPQQIALARSLAHDWLAPLSVCVGLMLPPGVEQQADTLYTALRPQPVKLTVTQTRLLKLLYERGPLRGSQIDRAMPRVQWRSAAQALKNKGALTTEAVLPAPRVRPRLRPTAALAVSVEQAEAALPNVGRAGSAALLRRQAILRFLMGESGPVDAQWAVAAAAEHSGGGMDDLRFLSGRGLVRLDEAESLRDPLAQTSTPPYPPPQLTTDQHSVWAVIQAQLTARAAGQSIPPVLLHGVTGSGKTEIYLHAVQHVLENGGQAIIMVPEIALTPQTVQRFAGRFPGRVGVLHSGLSDGERYDTWRQARAGKLSLVVGPRSALFTPFDHLQLIVVDECHDDSYYQSEGAPAYHAAQAAVRYAELAGALCLLGSATPDVAQAYQAKQDRWTLLKLPARILAHRQAVAEQMAAFASIPPALRARRLTRSEGQALSADLPPVTVIDMREELKSGNRSIFSAALQQSLQRTLDAHLQAILFLNRRGSATYVFCRDCGRALQCPRCEIPLTYHAAGGELRCHYCGYKRGMPNTCPKCGSARIKQFGAGTQTVEAEVQAAFPGVRTLRWDHETTRRKGAHQDLLAAFAAHQADVLIGTQMLAKGLDLPLVTLVGVVLADVGLNLPDYRTGERAFQVLTQVAGRAGRSPLGGQVILQSFTPDHYVIRAAAGHNYSDFYRQEIAFRRQQLYPPFANIARLVYSHYDFAKAEAAAQAMAAQARGWIEEDARRATRLIGPAPCFFGRISGVYRWQVVLVGPDPAALLRGRSFDGWKIEINPPDLL